MPPVQLSESQQSDQASSLPHLQVGVGRWGPIALHGCQPRWWVVVRHAQRPPQALRQHPRLGMLDLQARSHTKISTASEVELLQASSQQVRL